MPRAEAALATEQAMQRGAELIAQGVLAHGAWFGRPDFLLRNRARVGLAPISMRSRMRSSRVKRKRARCSSCARTASYWHVAGGAQPEFFHIAPGGGNSNLIALRTADYLSYYRLAKRRFEAFVAEGQARVVYPEPVEHCGVCGWWKRCEERRRGDDHLSLVAGITARQRDRLGTANVSNVTSLAA